MELMQQPNNTYSRLFPWQSLSSCEQTQTKRMHERLRGKRTLLSNLRNWISRDIVASAARLMSELFENFSCLHLRKLIDRVSGDTREKSFLTGSCFLPFWGANFSLTFFFREKKEARTFQGHEYSSKLLEFMPDEIFYRMTHDA